MLSFAFTLFLIGIFAASILVTVAAAILLIGARRSVSIDYRFELVVSALLLVSAILMSFGCESTIMGSFSGNGFLGGGMYTVFVAQLSGDLVFLVATIILLGASIKHLAPLSLNRFEGLLFLTTFLVGAFLFAITFGAYFNLGYDIYGGPNGLFLYFVTSFAAALLQIAAMITLFVPYLIWRRKN